MLLKEEKTWVSGRELPDISVCRTMKRALFLRLVYHQPGTTPLTAP